mmetsp:Transcript_6148/g.10309  ORF Transcript_6148/g.10309 Transcript_6148/m.10309 type:complete len:337 (+) Transcript_6148:120-1130(+)
MHPKRVLCWTEQHTDSMSHDRRLMQRGLTVHEHHVSIPQLPSNLYHSILTQQSCRNGVSTALLHLTQIYPLPIRKFHPHCSRILRWTSAYQILHIGNIQWSNRGRKSQSLGKVERQANLICTNVGVGRDDTSTGIINSFAHHVFAEDTLLLLQQLADTVRRSTGVATGVSGRIHEAIDGSLQVDPNTQRVGLSFILVILNLFKFRCNRRRTTVITIIRRQGMLQLNLFLCQFVRSCKSTPQTSVEFKHLGQVVVLRVFHCHVPHDHGRTEPTWRDRDSTHEEECVSITSTAYLICSVGCRSWSVAIGGGIKRVARLISRRRRIPFGRVSTAEEFDT